LSLIWQSTVVYIWRGEAYWRELSNVYMSQN